MSDARPYRITIIDNFHRHEPDGAWPGGTFATAEAAIASVKQQIDAELVYLWSEVCRQDKGSSTLKRLVSQYNSFAEMPIAFGPDRNVIFDSGAYMVSRAAEVVKAVPTQNVLPDPPPPGSSTEPQPAAPRSLQPDVAIAKPSRIRAIWAFLNKPRPVLLAYVIGICVLWGLIYQVLR